MSQSRRPIMHRLRTPYWGTAWKNQSKPTAVQGKSSKIHYPHSYSHRPHLQHHYEYRAWHVPSTAGWQSSGIPPRDCSTSGAWIWRSPDPFELCKNIRKYSPPRGTIKWNINGYLEQRMAFACTDTWAQSYFPMDRVRTALYRNSRVPGVSSSVNF